MKTAPPKGAENSKELAPALSHSYWLNSLDYFGSRHSAAFLHLCYHSYPANFTVAKFPKLNSSLFSESYIRLLLANHIQATPSIYTITHTQLLSYFCSTRPIYGKLVCLRPVGAHHTQP